jgi:membrane-associated phospholipid phosphatase
VGRDDPMREELPNAASSPVVEEVKDALSPTAPGEPLTSGVVVDLLGVVPNIGVRLSRISRLGIGAASPLVLLTIAVARHSGPIQHFDNAIHSWVVSHRSAAGISIARTITWGGVTRVTLPALVLVGALALRGHRPLGARLGSGALLAGVASIGIYFEIGLNSLVGRVRPPVADWAGAAGGPAFPSGHSTAATIFAVSCAWALTSRIRVGRPRVILWAVAGTFALAVGWSRVWLGVHWPTDVVSGWLFGVSWSALVVVTVVAARRRWPRLAMSVLVRAPHENATPVGVVDDPV